MDKINKREFLKMTTLLGAGAAVPALAAEDATGPATSPAAADLVDEHFACHFSPELYRALGELIAEELVRVRPERFALAD